jgi:hypothetical protein
MTGNNQFAVTISELTKAYISASMLQCFIISLSKTKISIIFYDFNGRVVLLQKAMDSSVEALSAM